ncbi:MAG TPA: riboflavin synthase, partial [Prolixibacteraceae bacterium]|nr:riboflavin synthase [Prolixibacteraceae bacterium]
MFSGIVEEAGKVVAIEKELENVHLTLTCSFVDELKVDQSLSHNGVCLTVVAVDQAAKTYRVTAVQETLLKSNLGLLEVGSVVNLERSMMM